jgi:hypothetical protein
VDTRLTVNWKGSWRQNILTQMRVKSQDITKYCTVKSVIIYFIISLICDNSVNSKFGIFQENLWKGLKCYNFPWVQWRHNCFPAASFASCVMTLYLLKVLLQTFISIPITQTNATFWVVKILSQMSEIFWWWLGQWGRDELGGWHEWREMHSIFWL